MKRPYLLWLRDHSTHWRATCRYDTDGTVYTDYLRASLEDFDIIRDVPIVTDGCRRRGNECVNCTARTWYKRPIPLHMDSTYRGSCQFDGSKIDPAKNDEDNFGLYASTNSQIPLYLKPEWYDSVLDRGQIVHWPNNRQLFSFCSAAYRGIEQADRINYDFSRPFAPTFRIELTQEIEKTGHYYRIKGEGGGGLRILVVSIRGS